MTSAPPYDSRVVANSFLELGAATLVPVTPMKLQKLVYIADGWNRVLNKRPLVADPVEAWQYGPVFPTLYHEFRHYGGKPIDAFYRELDLESFDFEIPEVETDPEKDVITRVWKSYGSLPATTLSALTHQSGTPWDQTFKTAGYRAKIRPSLIEQEFTSLLEKQRAAA